MIYSEIPFLNHKVTNLIECRKYINTLVAQFGHQKNTPTLRENVLSDIIDALREFLNADPDVLGYSNLTMMTFGDNTFEVVYVDDNIAYQLAFTLTILLHRSATYSSDMAPDNKP